MFLQKRYGYKTFPELPTGEDLPPLVVISGENGSGKTQFLEALNSGAFATDGAPNADNVRLITAADLGNPSMVPSSGETRQVLVDRFEQFVTGYLRPPGGLVQSNPDGVYDHLRQSWGIPQEPVARAEAGAGKRLVDWVRSDYERWAPLEVGGDFFNYSISDVFLRYRTLRTSNRYNRWLESEGLEHAAWIPEDGFEDTYGPAPWELLDEILAQLNLAYRFVPPSTDPALTTYIPLLQATAGDLQLDPAHLSSGEKTLLQIALSVYSGVHRRGISSLPSVLLLDEPDATLHPSMVKDLIRLVGDILVGQLGLNVIITTHSPTTVALAPESSLFIMSRAGEPRLRRASSRDEALSRLLVGVPTMSVSVERRRLVFVESPNDARWYSRQFEILAPHLGAERTLQFVAAGGSGLPDGCAAVVDLVRKLRQNGNIAVWGLVDRDDRAKAAGPGIVFNDERYSIENFVLDPLSIGLLLLAEATPDIVAAVPGSTFVKFRDEDAQVLADAVSAVLAGPGGQGETREVPYRGGLVLRLPGRLMVERGHGLADRVRELFPGLRQFSDDKKLLDTVLARVWFQYPQYVPLSCEKLFREILEE